VGRYAGLPVSAGSALSKPGALKSSSPDRTACVRHSASTNLFTADLHRIKGDPLETPPPLYDLRAFDISETEFQELLGRLCVRLGFCISSEASEHIRNQKLATIDEFLDALYLAEGLENYTRGSLRSAAKSEVQRFIASRRLP
jgi:hypothetical protein